MFCYCYCRGGGGGGDFRTSAPVGSFSVLCILPSPPSLLSADFLLPLRYSSTPTACPSVSESFLVLISSASQSFYLAFLFGLFCLGVITNCIFYPLFVCLLACLLRSSYNWLDALLLPASPP